MPQMTPFDASNKRMQAWFMPNCLEKRETTSIPLFSLGTILTIKLVGTRKPAPFSENTDLSTPSTLVWFLSRKFIIHLRQPALLVMVDGQDFGH